MARLCVAGDQLRNEINRRWPNRDTGADGWLGDAAHRSRRSDHNPNSAGVVIAIDVDKDGVNAPAVVEHLRGRGKAGDRRLVGGYVIWNSRIAGTHTSWNWHQYTGPNPHTSHFHVSFGDAASDYDRKGAWGIVQPPRPADRTLGLKSPLMSGQDVANVQKFLNSLGNRIKVDGIYGRHTADVVNVYKRNRGITEPGWGPKCWAQARKEIAARGR